MDIQDIVIQLKLIFDLLGLIYAGQLLIKSHFGKKEITNEDILILIIFILI